MNFLERFKAIVGIKKPTIVVVKKLRQRGPIKELPDVQRDELDFIEDTILRNKWSDVEFEGPGAAAAEARRTKRLGIKTQKDKKDGQKRK